MLPYFSRLRYVVLREAIVTIFADFGKNVAKRRSPLDLYPRAIAHCYYDVAPLELLNS